MSEARDGGGSRTDQLDAGELKPTASVPFTNDLAGY
jgi:hypothetical protein